MTARRLPRTARGRALPRGHDTATVSWPPALRGRSTLLCLLLLGWLGGGLLATALALVTESPNDLAYGMTNTVAAATGLLLLMVAGLRRAAGRRPTTVPVAAPVAAEVPRQADALHDDAAHHDALHDDARHHEPAHDDRREPALG